MEKLSNEIENWMVRRKKNSVKPATYDRLVTSLDMLKKYTISDFVVDEMSSDDIQDYINLLVSDGYALSTIKKQYHLIGAFFDYACFNGFVTRPIHKGVEIPTEMSVRKHKKEVVAYTHSEQNSLRRVMMRGDSPACYMSLFMMETGLRVGEALALGWDDIIWSRKAVRIHKTVVRLTEKKKSYVQMSAKSYTSNRTIPLSSKAIEILEILKLNSEPGGFIFHDEYGERLSYESLRWWTKKACDEAGVGYYGQHVFRHTFATNCYERGCDVKRLSKLLGHSDVSITYNVYIHLYGDALEEMRSVLD